MANYNPNAPQNIGQEWVPIRDENLIYNPYANSFERGYSFTLTAARNISNVRAYVNTMPNQFIMDRAFTASIYPKGFEDQSGPVRRVIIPCNGGFVTGADPASWSFIDVNTVAQAFWNPSSQQAIIYRVGFTYGSDTYMFFAVSQYQNLLQNKRILGVNFLTSIDIGTGTANTQENMQLWMANDNTIVQGSGGLTAFINAGAMRYPNLVTPTTPSTDVRFDRIKLGDVNRFFGTTGFNVASPNMDVAQWTYTELARFEASAANRINMAFHIPIAGVQFGFSTVIVSYAALEVFYCDEARVGFGTRVAQVNADLGSFSWPGNYISIGAMPVIVRTPAGNPLILQPGDYTVTFSESNFGDSYNGLRTPGRFPIFNENRQLYEIPTVPGVEISIPFPLNDEAINQTLTSASTALIPQLSLHASGASGTLFESHPYGRQTAGQVFAAGANNVQQRIDTTFLGTGTASFPWVRFWARRYGDTTGVLRVTSSTSTANISVAEFDALDEIVDGWKEVTLRFDIPRTLTFGTVPNLTWTPVPDQNQGNRWEILGAAAPALTGTPTNPMLGQVASPHTLTIATYGQPVSGGTILESWMPLAGNPFATSTTDDPTADVSFILAQDMPAVTGFSVITTSMAVSGIGRNCGIDPCCIPTAILYNSMSWTAMLGMFDDFNRTVVTGGWGTSSSGVAWTTTEPGNHSVNGSSGVETLYVTGTDDTFVRASFAHSNIDAQYTILPSAIPTGNRYLQAIYFRRRDDNNLYFLNVAIAQTTGAVSLEIGSAIAGVFTAFVTANTTVVASLTVPIAVRLQAVGTSFRAKVWLSNTAEPTAWNLTWTDSTFPNGNSIEMHFASDTGNTNVPPKQMFYDNLSITPWAFGAYEIQRMDTVDTTWQTIMHSTSGGRVSFNDYEARVGIQSSYRIRTLDTYDFPGPWSSTVNVTLPAIGVSGGSCLQNGHLLIFTTNEIQDGSSNLAYSSVWMDSQVVEDFGFAEAGFVQMQAMYNRDFFTAFRPNERGGERFSRTVLVQAAAISPPSLGDFRSLRDMAWDDVSYICVRDEDGNRWFATVLVPSGQVLRDRRLYLAPVDIVEITDTPSEVDP